MTKLCEGRVAIITGAGRGIGREHALLLAHHGAKVVVNDLGGSMDGEGTDQGPAQDVVDEIKAMGGEAIANGDDISDWDGAERLVQSGHRHLRRPRHPHQQRRHPARPHAHEHERGGVGRRHQGAPEGHLRARPATPPPTGGSGRRPARPTTPASSTRRRRRASTATSGQTNYGAAKAGIASFTIIAAKELGRYGVTVNAIAPAALTRMTEDLGMGQAPEEIKEQMSPAHIAPDRRAGWPAPSRPTSPGGSST